MNTKMISSLYISKSKVESISKGSTQEEVKLILGNPDLILNLRWIYRPLLDSNEVDVIFDQQKLVESIFYGKPKD